MKNCYESLTPSRKWGKFWEIPKLLTKVFLFFGLEIRTHSKPFSLSHMPKTALLLRTGNEPFKTLYDVEVVNANRLTRDTIKIVFQVK